MKTILSFFGSLIISLMLSGFATAQDAESSEALRKTQELLRSRQQRDAELKSNSSAQSNHSELEKMAGSQENVDAIYGLSADIFANIVKETNGDPILLQQKLQEAQKNPEAFLRKLSPEQRSRVEGLAKKIDAKK